MASSIAGLAATLTLLLCWGGAAPAAAWETPWRLGRATHYSAPGDVWTIHDGSCTHKYIWPDIYPGWDAGALDDQSEDFIGSCGRCYEVRCDPRNFTDGYGAKLDRSTVCYDPQASVVIQVVDACPCSYPGNYYSNKRWCCGDVDHIDLSVWAFEKLADLKWGVIALQYRPVPCTYVPGNVAPRRANPTPGIPPPAGAQRP